MVKDKKHRILVVDDTKENIETLFALLQDDYIILAAKNGESAIKKATTTKPDLILLDIMMPDMDGYEVCKRLKEDDETKDIPIIFITALTESIDQVKAFQLGGSDYITKPFAPVVVKARIENHLKLRDSMRELERLYGMALDANPMTQLPGNNSVAKRIDEAFKSRKDYCVIYCDLDNFKPFNDKFGFALGDDVILYTSKALECSVAVIEKDDSFIGHIGGDDFVVIVASDQAELVAEQIISQFDSGIEIFYTPEDVENGFIEAVSRRGIKDTFPLISISLAGVDLSHGVYKNYLEVIDACATTKKRAKSISGSCFVVDRRRA